MTTALVLRLDKKRAELVKQEARKRGSTRNAVVRQALDKLLGEPRTLPVKQNGVLKNGAKKAGKKPSKGVGWAEHFKWMEKHGRKVDWKDVLEYE